MSKRDDGAYNLRKVFEQMELELVQNLRRNLKRHEKEEEKEGFRWEMWQRAKLRNLRTFRQGNKKIVDGYSEEVERIIQETLHEEFSRTESFMSRMFEKIRNFFSKRGIRFPHSISNRRQWAAPPVEKDFFGVNKKKLETLQEETEKGEKEDDIQPKDAPEKHREEKTQQERHQEEKNGDIIEPEEPYHPEGKEKELFGHTNDAKLDSMTEQVTHDLKEAQKAVWRNMDDIYRRTIYKAEMNMASGAKTLYQAIDMATKEFLEAGINCIEYRNGRRVNIASYAEMALRTASQRATLLAEGKKRDEWGVHTVVVTAHANTCPLCALWQGKVLVDDVYCHGTAEEAKELNVPLLSTAMKAGLLHPNCRHTISIYFPGVTKLPQVPDTKKAIETYKAEQEQRALERKIRKWKRIAEGSMEPEKVKLAEDKEREYQKEIKEHLERNPELRRDYDREKTRGLVEQFSGKVNEARADKLFYIVPPSKGDAIKAHSLYKNLNKSAIGREVLKFIEQNQVDIEITYSEEIGEGLRGRTFGNHIEIYARNTRTIKETAKALVHEATHMMYDIGEDQWSEVVCMLKELEHEKGMLTAEDKRTTIKVVRRLYPELPWRKR